MSHERWKWESVAALFKVPYQCEVKKVGVHYNEITIVVSPPAIPFKSVTAVVMVGGMRFALEMTHYPDSGLWLCNREDLNKALFALETQGKETAEAEFVFESPSGAKNSGHKLELKRKAA